MREAAAWRATPTGPVAANRGLGRDRRGCSRRRGRRGSTGYPEGRPPRGAAGRSAFEEVTAEGRSPFPHSGRTLLCLFQVVDTVLDSPREDHADRTALSDASFPLLAVDLSDEPGRTFRIPAQYMPEVAANLAICNMHFSEFAAGADPSGTYRGFSGEWTGPSRGYRAGPPCCAVPPVPREGLARSWASCQRFLRVRGQPATPEQNRLRVRTTPAAAGHVFARRKSGATRSAGITSRPTVTRVSTTDHPRLLRGAPP
ncbi:DUF6924 domain-containing protein [Streptomyces uncialis]|uniref:DUF6924 domain-containing protein n=1 Tax=Streptomyces uncialis TaxID=1048205 RepID=UPI0038270147